MSASRTSRHHSADANVNFNLPLVGTFYDLVLIKMLNVNLDAKGIFRTRRDFQFTWDAKDFQFTWDAKWIFIYLGREMVFQFTWDSKWIFNLGTRMDSHYQGRERIFNLPGTRKDFQFTWDANEF